MSTAKNLSRSALVARGIPRMSRFEKWSRRQIIKILSALRRDALSLVDAMGRTQCGAAAGEDAISVEVQVHDPRFYTALALGGSMGGAEAYMAGWWSSSDLTGLVRIVARNQDALGAMESGLARLTQLIHHGAYALRRNSRRGSKRNIEAHYDLSNDFFRLFLDPTMTYSCGVFESEDTSMEEASVAKLDQLCRKLRLVPEDHLLEIGSGWGSLAIHAASQYGCRVTTTTISEEQHALAKARIEAAGISDRVTILKKDYRDLCGTYDKVISIEMIEAVGHAFVPAYFKKCCGLLKPGGLMALQAITIPDQQYDFYRRTPDFINRYIFPGGCLPSITSVCNAMTRVSQLRLQGLEDITPHYARTLALWRERFMENLEDVRKLGFPERFIRMWEYYLCYCEGGFRERSIGTVQMLLTKP